MQVRADAQRRIYSLDAGPLAEIDDWLVADRRTWNRHVDALTEHLDRSRNAREGAEREF